MSKKIDELDKLVPASKDIFEDFLKTYSASSHAAIRTAIRTVIIENGTTYVSSKLFTDIFGWEFSDATYDMLQNSYWYGFYTMQE